MLQEIQMYQSVLAQKDVTTEQAEKIIGMADENIKQLEILRKALDGVKKKARQIKLNNKRLNATCPKCNYVGYKWVDDVLRCKKCGLAQRRYKRKKDGI